MNENLTFSFAIQITLFGIHSAVFFVSEKYLNCDYLWFGNFPRFHRQVGFGSKAV